MITKEKLTINLDILRSRIPKKPEKYTSDHPLTIKESLDKYSNQRSVHGIEISVVGFDENNWPLPLWVDMKNIHFGYFNTLNYKVHKNSQYVFIPDKTGKHVKKMVTFTGLKDFDYLQIPFVNKMYYRKSYNETLVDAFDANIKYIERKLKSNPIFNSKIIILEEIFKVYKEKYWIACMSTIFPLLDFVARKLLNTKKLSVDIGKICKLFEQNGFGYETVDYLMPHTTSVLANDPAKNLSKEQKKEIYEKVKDNYFGISGAALSSFLRFANHYYGYYKEDTGDTNIINRHAILHGSISSFGNQANVVKLFTFLFLLLELEPVFEILLNDA